MLRSRKIAQGALILTLIACPMLAYWASSRDVWWLPLLVLAFGIFYISCAVALRSPTVTGALLGILAAAILSPPVGGYRSSHIYGIVFLASAGAFLGVLVDRDRSQRVEDSQPNGE